ncbi:MAG: hypothetical protein COT81_04535 [Candidatus Buchananbacteria bacterium CG10_big_fil_rev_8_21_14_0_10_42_9]|uniref:Uncharacterized protein n=1 Tax=Candidatus Buchananbacteria bacterium CG10_big_fil_rev_8_21_14_0_10_42_9 TaxID=1974526 RepID=A0A2H0W0F0_9BACT|nr:MAG: hypothetical protein COT81_04535 [Candidatus Buchananbacteria bacterium CG10_big_fil_rev_8_21_14_0_10_42_9]
MNSKKLIVLAVILIVTVSGGFFLFYNRQKISDRNGAIAPGTTVTTAPAINGVTSSYRPEDYQDNLKNILDEFWANTNRPNTVNDLLALTLPFEYQNLHLAIVQAMLEYEQTGSQLALERLQQIRSENSWLQ